MRNRLLESNVSRGLPRRVIAHKWYQKGSGKAGKYGYQALEPSTTAYLGMNGGDESAYVSQGHRTDDYDDDAWYASTPGEDQNEEGWNAWTELPGRPVGSTAHEEDQIASDEDTAVALNALEECDFENFPDATAQAIQLQRAAHVVMGI